MLNGVDPIILFNFKKLSPSTQESIAKIPLLADVVNVIDLPVVPIYLSEKLTGIYIDAESKSIDIDTTTDSLTNGDAPAVTQRTLNSSIRIEMVASRNSIGASIFAAMADLIFPKVTSKEYSITYLHGAITVFAGLLHGFSITQNANNDLYNITLELIKPSPGKAGAQVVQKITGALPL
jgi:hypothetical protein